MTAYILLCGGFHGNKMSPFTLLRLPHPEARSQGLDQDHTAPSSKTTAQDK